MENSQENDTAVDWAKLRRLAFTVIAMQIIAAFGHHFIPQTGGSFVARKLNYLLWFMSIFATPILAISFAIDYVRGTLPKKKRS